MMKSCRLDYIAFFRKEPEAISRKWDRIHLAEKHLSELPFPEKHLADIIHYSEYKFF